MGKQMFVKSLSRNFGAEVGRASVQNHLEPVRGLPNGEKATR
jgi:hypothetical protein